MNEHTLSIITTPFGDDEITRVYITPGTDLTEITKMVLLGMKINDTFFSAVIAAAAYWREQAVQDLLHNVRPCNDQTKA